MRGQVNGHAAPDHGRVTKFLAGQDCGFIETPDGREIYFHRNAVLDRAFDRLTIGSEVRFVEEAGDKGPQASTVRLIGKHHPV
jgi:cold shock CspA family protein